MLVVSKNPEQIVLVLKDGLVVSVEEKRIRIKGRDSDGKRFKMSIDYNDLFVMNQAINIIMGSVFHENKKLKDSLKKLAKRKGCGCKNEV